MHSVVIASPLPLNIFAIPWGHQKGMNKEKKEYSLCVVLGKTADFNELAKNWAYRSKTALLSVMLKVG